MVLISFSLLLSVCRNLTHDAGLVYAFISLVVSPHCTGVIPRYQTRPGVYELLPREHV